MSDLKKYKRIIAGVTIVSLLLFVAIYFVYSQIRTKNEQILSIEQDISSKDTRHAYLISMQRLLKNSEPNIDKIEKSIVSSSGDVEFIESIEAIAKSYNLNIQIDSLNIVNNDTKNSTSSVSTLRVKAKADGLWSNIYLFLGEIESMPYRVKFNKLALASSGELLVDGKTNQQNKNWQVSFEISVLKYK